MDHVMAPLTIDHDDALPGWHTEALGALGLSYTGVMHAGRLSWVLQVRTAEGLLRAARLLRPQLLDTPEEAQEVEEWARRTAAVRSPAAAIPLELGQLPEPGKGPYLLMDWLEGRPLREHLRVRGQAMLPENAFHLLRQVAQGLASLHAADLVHGDVRAESVLLTRQGRAVLVDVGIVPWLRRRAEGRRGVVWSASRYAPPERTGEELAATPQADVYQLGALAWEMFSGGSFSRWVPLEELSEMVDYLPPAMDELVQACLSSPAERPANAGEFLTRLEAVEQAFEENQRRGRTRDHGSARQLWERAAALAAGAHPPWGYVAALCRRVLGMRPHLMPFGKVAERPVRELLEEAERRLRAGRYEFLMGLLERGNWAVATAFVDQLAEEVPTAEVEELRVVLERARLKAAGDRAELRKGVGQRLLALLKAPELSTSARLQAVELLEQVLRHDVPAVATAGRRVTTIAPVGALKPVEQWEVGGAPWSVVLGDSMRLGRGSWQEFRNHVDLRPTREEVEESSSTLLLAQVLSRAGHLEFRVGREGLEAVCLGTHGATVDGQPLQRGEARVLGVEGQCRLAGGAVDLHYRAWANAYGEPVALTVVFTDGLGRGRAAVWVLQRLPLQALHTAGLECGALLPTPEGWEVEAWQDGILLGDDPLSTGSRRRWEAGVPLCLPAGLTVMRRTAV